MEEFLKRDQLGLSDKNFSTTRQISQILIQKQDIKLLYDDYIKKENECEDILNKIIDENHEVFNTMISKPTTYGKAYENISKLVRSNQRKLQKAKESLQFTSTDLKMTYNQQIYNKDILDVLLKLDQIQQSFSLIQSQMNYTYDACLEYIKARDMIDTFKNQDYLQIINLRKQLAEYGQQIFYKIRDCIEEFFFGQKKEIFEDTKIYYEASNRLQQTNKLKEIQQIYKETVPQIKDEDDLLRLCIEEQAFNIENDPYNALRGISYNQLKQFIKFAFTFEDFNKVKLFVDQNTDNGGKFLISQILGKNLLDIFISIKCSQQINLSNKLLQSHFDEFKINLQDYFTQKLIIFLKDQINYTELGGDLLFQQLNFTNLVKYQQISNFFKSLYAHAAIIIRKQILLGKIMQYFNIDIDENTQILTISELVRQLFWQINICLSIFYKNDEVKKRDILDARNEFHLFINNILRKIIKPSPMYYLLQKQLLESALLENIEGIKSFMRIEPIFKEPIEQEVDLQNELKKSIYQGCFQQLFDDVQNVVRKIFLMNQGEKYMRPLPYNENMIKYEFQDEKLQNIMVMNIKNLDSFKDNRFIIQEILQLGLILNSLNVIHQVADIQNGYLKIINWILEVYKQQLQQKFKSCIEGSLSEQLLQSQDKISMQKKTISYLQWKVKNQQQNEIINDGINTQSRLEQALKTKQYKQQVSAALIEGYKEYLVGKVKIKEIELIRSKEMLHTLCSLHDNTHSLLELIKIIFFNYLSLMQISKIIKIIKLSDQIQLAKELELGPKDIPNEMSLQSKMTMIKNYQFRCQQTIQLDKPKGKNAFDYQFNDDFKQSIYRFLQLNEQIFDIQRNCYLILRFDFHLRIIHYNVQDLCTEYINFTQCIQNQTICYDFWTMFKASLKSQFLRDKDYNQKRINMILKDLNVLKEHLKFDQSSNKKITLLRRYFKMYLVKPVDMEKFLKINSFKYKLKHVLEYTGNEQLKKYCI